MTIRLFAGSLELGNVESRIIDASMGVIGGELKPSNTYLESFQAFFRSYNQQPDWVRLQVMNLSAVSSSYGVLKAAGGICVTDIEGFAEIEVEICGVEYQITSKL